MTESKFIKRINLFLDDEISPDELSILIREIKEDGNKRRIFSEYCYLNDATRMAFFRYPDLFQKDAYEKNPAASFESDKFQPTAMHTDTDGLVSQPESDFSVIPSHRLRRFRNLMTIAACVGFSIASFSFFYRTRNAWPENHGPVDTLAFDLASTENERIASVSDASASPTLPLPVMNSVEVFNSRLVNEKTNIESLFSQSVVESTSATIGETSFELDSLSRSDEFIWEDSNITPELIMGVFQEGTHAAHIDFSDPEIVRRTMETLLSERPDSKVIWSASQKKGSSTQIPNQENLVSVRFGR